MKKSINVYLHSLGYKKEQFNTTNAWGFGGGVGISYTKDNIEVRIGTACYRYASPSKFATVSVDGRRIYDKANLTVERFEALFTGTQS